MIKARKQLVIILFSLLFISFVLESIAGNSFQNEKKYIDKLIGEIKDQNGVTITFVNTVRSGKEINSAENGTIFLKKNMWHVDMKTIKIWNNGKTQWVYFPENNEVNVQKSESEKPDFESNPFLVLSDFYKYYKIESSTKKGDLIEMNIVPSSASEEIKKIVFVFSSKTDKLKRIDISFKNNLSLDLQIKTFKTGNKMTDKDFSFPKEKYPSVEELDLD